MLLENLVLLHMLPVIFTGAAFEILSHIWIPCGYFWYLPQRINYFPLNVHPFIDFTVHCYFVVSDLIFFNSEYVRNLNQICRYNCRRKNEFIKKGLGKCCFW